MCHVPAASPASAASYAARLSNQSCPLGLGFGRNCSEARESHAPAIQREPLDSTTFLHVQAVRTDPNAVIGAPPAVNAPATVIPNLVLLARDPESVRLNTHP